MIYRLGQFAGQIRPVPVPPWPPGLPPFPPPSTPTPLVWPEGPLDEPPPPAPEAPPPAQPAEPVASIVPGIKPLVVAEPAPQPVGGGMVAFFPTTYVVRRTYYAMPAARYVCPQWPGVYCPPQAVRPMPSREELVEDQAARLETPIAAKVATVGGLGALLAVGLAAAGAFGGG